MIMKINKLPGGETNAVIVKPFMKYTSFYIMQPADSWLEYRTFDDNENHF